MAEEKTKKVVTAVFLFALFILVALYIGLTVLKIYTDSSKFSSEKSESSVSCIGYSYSIDNIKYENGLLTFDLKNSEISDYEEMILIVKSGNATKELQLTNLVTGIKKGIDLDIELKDNQFKTYPKSCEQDAKTNSIDSV